MTLEKVAPDHKQPSFSQNSGCGFSSLTQEVGMVSTRTLHTGLGHLLPKSAQFLHNLAPIQARITNYSLSVKASVHTALCTKGKKPAEPTVKSCRFMSFPQPQFQGQLLFYDWKLAACRGFLCYVLLSLPMKTYRTNPITPLATEHCVLSLPLGPCPHPMSDKIPSPQEAGPGNKVATVSSTIHQALQP